MSDVAERLGFTQNQYEALLATCKKFLALDHKPDGHERRIKRVQKSATGLLEALRNLDAEEYEHLAAYIVTTRQFRQLDDELSPDTKGDGESIAVYAGRLFAITCRDIEVMAMEPLPTISTAKYTVLRKGGAPQAIRSAARYEVLSHVATAFRAVTGRNPTIITGPDENDPGEFGELVLDVARSIGLRTQGLVRQAKAFLSAEKWKQMERERLRMETRHN